MQLADFPRVRLAHLPTPLEPLDRLSEAFGGPRLWVKRDDCTGLALGGNKTRKLEFLMGEALKRGADTVITAGGVQSNHVRQTAAAAAKLGLACELVLARVVPRQAGEYEETGNVQLDRLFGASLHLRPGDIDRDKAVTELAGKLRATGRNPYVIPIGGSSPTGALGYVNCALELEVQARQMDIRIDYIVVAASSGGTQAGLVAGFHAVDSRTKVIGIDVDAHPAEVGRAVRQVAVGTAELLSLSSFKALPDQATIVKGGWAGEAYGLPTADMKEAVTLMARAEGIVLDPVYTGKALAGLLGMIRDGTLKPSDRVVFLHSGGSPALFAYRPAFAENDAVSHPSA